VNNTSIWYGKVKDFEPIGEGLMRVYFEGGSCHLMKNAKVSTGDVVGIDTHGNIWRKSND
jgi:hypothetical protein